MGAVRFCWLFLSGCLLLPVPLAAAAPMVPAGRHPALDESIERQGRQFYAFNALPFGLSLNGHFDDPADAALIDAFLAQTASDDVRAVTGRHPFEILSGYGEHGDLGFFGGVALAATACRYLALKREGAPAGVLAEARARVVRAAESWHVFYIVTGGGGLVARGIDRLVPENPADPPIPGGRPPTVPLADASGPLPRPKDNGIDRDDNSAGALPPGTWAWIDSASKDQLSGQVFGMALLYEAMKDDPDIDQALVARMQADARLVGRMLKEKREISGLEGPVGAGLYDLIIMDADGRPTFYHDLNPLSLEKIYLPHDSDRYNVFNLFMTIGVITGLYHVSGDPELEEYLYRELLAGRGLLDRARRALSDPGAFDYTYMGVNTNTDVPDMTAVALWLSLFHETDPEVAGVVRDFLERGWWEREGESRTARLSKQPFWHAVYLALTDRGSDAGLIDELADLLAGFRLGPYWNERVENCDPAELAARSCLAVDGTTVLTLEGPDREGELLATEALDPRIRPPSDFNARSNPFRVNGGGGLRLNPGGDLMAAYWIVRYLEALEPGQVHRSRFARSHMPVGGWPDSDGDGETDSPADGDQTTDGDDATDTGKGCSGHSGTGGAIMCLLCLLLASRAARRVPAPERRETRLSWSLVVPLVLVSLPGCGGGGDPAGALDDRLADALDFEEGELVAEAPPEGSSDAAAPEASDVRAPLVVRLGDPFLVSIVTGFDRPADVTGAVVAVGERPRRHVQIRRGLQAVEDGSALRIVGRLRDDARLRGHTFTIRIALQTAGGLTGPYTRWQFSVPDLEARGISMEAERLDAAGAEWNLTGRPAGSASADAPQIDRSVGPGSVSLGQPFSLLFYSLNLASPDDLALIVMSAPGSDSWLAISSFEARAAEGGGVLVELPVTVGNRLLAGAELVLLFALQDRDGRTGRYEPVWLTVDEGGTDGDADGDGECPPRVTVPVHSRSHCVEFDPLAATFGSIPLSPAEYEVTASGGFAIPGRAGTMSDLFLANTTNDQPLGWFYALSPDRPRLLTIGTSGYNADRLYVSTLVPDPASVTGSIRLSIRNTTTGDVIPFTLEPANLTRFADVEANMARATLPAGRWQAVMSGELYFGGEQGLPARKLLLLLPTAPAGSPALVELVSGSSIEIEVGSGTDGSPNLYLFSLDVIAADNADHAAQVLLTPLDCAGW